MPRLHSCARLLLVLVTSTLLWAQFDSGQISGFVRDPSEAVVSGVVVTATNEGNGQQQSSTTNNNGYYVFPNLPVGSYTITAQVTGFKKSSQTGIVLNSAAKVNVDLVMTVGQVTETVEVKASTSQVQTETAQVGRVIETRQIQDLTLNGRNPIFLALLKPGVVGGSIGAFQPDDVTNGGFSINGGRSDEYVVMVDGAVATRTRSSGSMLGAQDVDSVQEVQVLTANYNAEYGHDPENAFAALGYDTLMLMADAIKRAGSTDSAAVKLRPMIGRTPASIPRTCV